MGERGEDWQPIFGQDDKAQGSLEKYHLQEGDLFLFFGLFKEIKRNKELFTYKERSKKKDPGIHSIFGCLEVGKTIKVNTDTIPGYVKQHVHLITAKEQAANKTLYVDCKNSSI